MILVRIANTKDPDQTASSEAVLSGSALFDTAFLPGKLCLKFRTFTILYENRKRKPHVYVY